MSKWQKIDTAPRDGTHILLLMEDRIIEGYRDPDDESWDCVVLSMHGCGCCGSANDEPTHWMPLPAKPEPGNA